MNSYYSIKLNGTTVSILDQRLLPHTVTYNEYSDWKQVARAIREMEIRGAPAIGIAGAFGVAIAAHELQHLSYKELTEHLISIAQQLGATRPTAVNLRWAISRIERILEAHAFATSAQLVEAIVSESKQIYAEDIETNKAICALGAALVPDNANIIHHCNTGSLACADYGTALGILRMAHEQGKRIHVYLDETRPRLQGATLSAWELQQQGVPHTVIVDGASGYVMRTKKIDLCIVGCDRVAANGDTANKIGTYNLAVVAKAHTVPFYVACPMSSIDSSISSGDMIEIEERNASEITHYKGSLITPPDTAVFNPAFDVTPSEYISGFITERGILHPPFKTN